MGIGPGMRGTDLQKFLMVARDRKVILLIRHTNQDSLRYIGVPGYYPKPAPVKAKTADFNPPGVMRSVAGRMVRQEYTLAGLVAHPGMHPGVFKPAKQDKVAKAWADTMCNLAAKALAPGDPLRPETWAAWGADRAAACSPEWHWRFDVDPASRHYGCLQLNHAGTGWMYIHGDYDLKDVIVPGYETDNRRHEGTVDGVKNYTPLLKNNLDFERIRAALNQLIGADMVQHGADAQFAWHGDEPITVMFPDWTFLLLADAGTVQRWYENMNRAVLADKGKDYVNDESRMFKIRPHGLFAPGDPRADRR